VTNVIKIEGITAEISVSESGVYLLINRPPGNKNRLDFGTIRSMIEDCGVQDWDFAAVLEAVEDMSNDVKKLISTNMEIKSVDESIEVHVSPDKMTAELLFVAPVSDGLVLELADIKKAIANAKVVSGIDENVLNAIAEKRVYGMKYVVAKGKEPEHGINGSVDFKFETGKKSYKPKQLEDGKVDYHNLDLFLVTSKGSLLAVITKPTEGVDGFNVAGDVKKALKGKAALNPAGKNTRLTDDGLELYSEIDGQIVFANNRVSVSPVLEIQSNVDTYTGNINFLGTVVVKGNVLSGFSITASGNVEIFGVVEGASINCEGNLYIKGGVQGIGKAELSAGGSIMAKFIENSTVNANADITADTILHSLVRCGGSLTLVGKRGQLLGGTAKVMNSVNALSIGSSMEATTEVQVGLDPDLYDDYRKKKSELKKLKEEQVQLDQIINTLAKLRQGGNLTEQKKAILVKSLQTKTHIRTKMSQLQLDIENIVPSLSSGAGIIKVSRAINPGVKVTIGNAIMYVKSKLEYCSLVNVDGEIKIGTL
jgi:hypothetical protein